ncbi:MAG: ribonuclease III [Firmicutes bacterium]|nr:ribonuclease III [Bacillota bacterium]
MKDSARLKKLLLLQNLLNVEFSNLDLLDISLTHGSYAYESKKQGIHNERLEFLGDSVLGLVITHYLYEHFPSLEEGELARMKSSLVSAPILAEKAKFLDLGAYLKLGRGEEKAGGRVRSSILADTMEALMGAVYLDRGFKTTKNFILKLFQDDLETISSLRKDYKTIIQEYFQHKYKALPEYIVTSEYGPAHKKNFTVELFFRRKKIGWGKGKNKKEAQQEAAKSALNQILARDRSFLEETGLYAEPQS